VPRHEARARALQFSWAYASRLFVGHLVPARKGAELDRASAVVQTVTQMSSNV
jgi:hypothetical protein